MNKTIIININGIVFHIEEDAYDVLRAYMIEVKKHFAHTEGGNEIVSDIENRIAEMFSERIVQGKREVITMEDVREICQQMGHVSDFEQTGAEFEAGSKESDSSNYFGPRKLFRDPDDKVFGGVCSGLGHYLDLDTVWIRLGMALLFIFAGTGLLVYLILWIVVPQAKTRGDRMAMRGEAPNIQNFKKNIEEELGGLRGNFTVAGERIKPGLHDLSDRLEKIAQGIAKAFVFFLKALGGLMILGLSLCIIGLLIGWVVLVANWGNYAGSWYGPDFPLFYLPKEYQATMAAACFFALAIPLFALVLLGVRVVFNRHIAGSYVGFSLLIGWLVAVGGISYFVIQTMQDFSEDASVVQTKIIVPCPEYYVDLHNEHVLIKDGTAFSPLDSLQMLMQRSRKTGQISHRRRPHLSVLKEGQGQSPRLFQEFKASGENVDIAAARAGKIQYLVYQHQQHLLFDDQILLPKEELWRDQQVFLQIRVPVGTKLFLSREAARYIDNLPHWQRSEEGQEDQQAYTEWVMTEEGLAYTPFLDKKEEIPSKKE